MNLAIEYMIRSKELYCNVKFPFSVFIENPQTTEKRVITVCESFNEKKLVVRQWFIDNCVISDMVPSFSDYEINRDELRDSKHIIIPKFRLLKYFHHSFDTGKKQNSSGLMASIDELKYNSGFESLLNSKKHQSAKATWLWNSFKKVYEFQSKNNTNIFYDDKNEIYARILKNQFPHLLNNWIMWRKYMLDLSNDPGSVAGELFFHEEYKNMEKRENYEQNPSQINKFTIKKDYSGIEWF